MEVSVSKRKFLCVEYPGVVEDEEKALQTLGGENSISQVFRTKGQRLELRYRPDDLYCKPTCANKYTTASLLLKVRKVKKKGQVETPDGDTEYEYQGEIIGIISGIYKFTNMTDFQYLPMSRISPDSGYKSLRDDLWLDQVKPLSWISRSKPLHLPPALFSRIENPADFYYRDGVTSNPMNKGLTTNPNIIPVARSRCPHFTKMVMFDNPDVPMEPHPQALRKVKRKSNVFEVYKKVSQMFKTRPIWTRVALVMNLDQPGQYLKIILPAVAYYTLTGPWRRVWVRFGYDPRKDPQAKIYQVVDFRIKDKKLSEKLGITIKRSSTNYKLPNVMTRVNTVKPKIKQFELRAGDPSDSLDAPSQMEKDACYKFYPGLIPVHHQICYQFCELFEPKIQELVHCNDGKETECTEKDGWCLPNTTESIRKIILDHLLETAKNPPASITGSLPASSQNPSPDTCLSLADESTTQRKEEGFMDHENEDVEDDEDLNTEEEEMMEGDSSDEQEQEVLDDG